MMSSLEKQCLSVTTSTSDQAKRNSFCIDIYATIYFWLELIWYSTKL